MSQSTAFIALGSNLGDRASHIHAAIDSLNREAQIRVTAASAIIETAPVGPVPQPAFLNAVVRVATTFDARQLLQRCLAIEACSGRDRTSKLRWGPRIIDLDLLLFADQIIDEPGLRVPHPHLHERLFVLQPLAELAPNLLHPVLQETIESLLARQLAAAGVE